MKDILMGIRMRVTSSMEKPTAKASIIGQMGKFTTENGKRVSKTDTECGEVYLVIVIWVNGSRVKLMVTVSINGKTVIDMKDHGLNV